jgi:GntP family gluconate:H+ symporter
MADHRPREKAQRLMFWELPPAGLLALALSAVVLLVVLVTWLKVNPIISLLLAALIAGIGAGIPPLTTLQHFQKGLGETLGNVSLIIILGAMLGRLLGESGGALVLARGFQNFFGPAHAVLCICVLALVVGLATWFTVGFYLLLPIVFSLTRETRRPLLFLALPMMAFLSFLHGITPPHPGPVAAILELGANSGQVLLYGLLAGVPTALVAGPGFAWVCRNKLPVIAVPEPVLQTADRPAPGFLITVSIMLLPVLLMVAETAGTLLLDAEDPWRQGLAFVGNPVMALTIALLLAMCFFGFASGFSRTQVSGFGELSVMEIGLALLVVGAGGGFARVLREAGIATALQHVTAGLSLSPLVYAWLLAAFLRVATGSANVAITAGSGLLLPLLQNDPTINRELLVLALGFGSLFLSHLNDGGFWIVKTSLGMSVGETLRTWTVMETLIGLVGLGFTLFLDALL